VREHCERMAIRKLPLTTLRLALKSGLTHYSCLTLAAFTYYNPLGWLIVKP
jgi:hypothetical protein